MSLLCVTENVCKKIDNVEKKSGKIHIVKIVVENEHNAENRRENRLNAENVCENLRHIQNMVENVLKTCNRKFFIIGSKNSLK